MKENKIIDYMGVILMIVTFCLLIFVFTILAVTKTPAFETDEVIYLTEEEMANRPIIETEVTEDYVKIEEIEEVLDYSIEEESFVPNDSIPLSAYLQELSTELCREYKVGYAFFLAMCESESSFDTEARGDSGKSRGLMQINRPNWERYGLDASMVGDNLEIGIRMMGELIEKYGEVDAVIMAYKGGESFADEWLAQGKRLSACDEIVDRTMYWQSVIDGCEE